MDRRSFLFKATLAAAALAVDPEQLLWTPKKTIFIPSGITQDLDKINREIQEIWEKYSDPSAPYYQGNCGGTIWFSRLALAG